MLARPARARARRHPGRARPGRRGSGSAGRDRPRLLDVALLAEARPPGRWRAGGWRPWSAAPWSHDDPRLRARLLEALGGTLLVAGRDPPRWGRATRRRSSIWQAHRRRRRDRQRPLQRLVHPTPSPRGRVADAVVCRPRMTWACATSRRRATSTTASATAAARPTPCGRSATTTTSTRTRAAASPTFGAALEIFREVGDRTMEAWSLHMLGVGAAAQRRPDRRARGPSSRRSASSRRPATRRA